MEPVVLHTERLVLRTPAERDIDRITAACGDPDVAKYTTVPHPYSREHAEAFVTETVPAWWESGSSATFAITESGEDDLLGVIGLDRIADGNAHIGYWMSPGGRGRGFMLEAARRVVAFGFAEAPDGLGLHRISWEALASNGPSTRIARALGFHFEGIRRSHVVRLDERHDFAMAGLLRSDDPAEAPDWP